MREAVGGDHHGAVPAGVPAEHGGGGLHTVDETGAGAAQVEGQGRVRAERGGHAGGDLGNPLPVGPVGEHHQIEVAALAAGVLQRRAGGADGHVLQGLVRLGDMEGAYAEFGGGTGRVGAAAHAHLALVAAGGAREVVAQAGEAQPGAAPGPAFGACVHGGLLVSVRGVGGFGQGPGPDVR